MQGRESIGAIFHNGGIKKAGIEFSASWFYGNTDFVEEDGFFFPEEKEGFVNKGKFIAIKKQKNCLWKFYRDCCKAVLPAFQTSL